MFSAQDVIDIYQRLLAEGIQIWLVGGWGIDALLGKQTRPHKDIDVIMLLDDVVRMRELLEQDGYSLKMLWEENHWAVDAQGVETATAYVLHDAEGREFDMHAMRIDDQGNGIPEWDNPEGIIFTRQDLAGEGTIAGVPVKCISPESQLACHTGYELPDDQARDLELLRERFDISLPEDMQNA
jgi:lincosamide nucleotidyltransferase A/C/D/E